MKCARCADVGWLCEDHPGKPMGHYGCKGAGDPCPACNALHRRAPETGGVIDTIDVEVNAMAEQLDELIAEVWESYLANQKSGDPQPPDQHLRAVLHGFALEIFKQLLPDDPAAREAYVSKAAAFGIEVGDDVNTNVVSILEHIQRRNGDK